MLVWSLPSFTWSVLLLSLGAIWAIPQWIVLRHYVPDARLWLLVIVLGRR